VWWHRFYIAQFLPTARLLHVSCIHLIKSGNAVLDVSSAGEYLNGVYSATVLWIMCHLSIIQYAAHLAHLTFSQHLISAGSCLQLWHNETFSRPPTVSVCSCWRGSGGRWSCMSVWRRPRLLSTTAPCTLCLKKIGLLRLIWHNFTNW